MKQEGTRIQNPHNQQWFTTFSLFVSPKLKCTGRRPWGRKTKVQKLSSSGLTTRKGMSFAQGECENTQSFFSFLHSPMPLSPSNYLITVSDCSNERKVNAAPILRQGNLSLQLSGAIAPKRWGQIPRRSHSLPLGPGCGGCSCTSVWPNVANKP